MVRCSAKVQDKSSLIADDAESESRFSELDDNAPQEASAYTTSPASSYQACWQDNEKDDTEDTQSWSDLGSMVTTDPESHLSEFEYDKVVAPVKATAPEDEDSSRGMSSLHTLEDRSIGDPEPGTRRYYNKRRVSSLSVVHAALERNRRKVSMSDLAFDFDQEHDSIAMEESTCDSREAIVNQPARPTRSRRTKRAAQQNATRSAAASPQRLQCPECMQVFPRTVSQARAIRSLLSRFRNLTHARWQSYFDEAEYEKKVFAHIVKCSSSESSQRKQTGRRVGRSVSQMKPPANLGKPRGAQTSSSKPKSSVHRKTKTVRKAPRNILRKPDRVATFSGSQTARISRENGMTKVVPPMRETKPLAETGQKPRSLFPKVIDSKHFLAQVWWRKGQKGQRKKRAMPMIPFNLQQCVVSSEAGLESKTDENEARSDLEKEEPTRRTRGSKRKQSRTEDSLRYACPVCHRVFTEGWLVSVVLISASIANENRH